METPNIEKSEKRPENKGGASNLIPVQKGEVRNPWGSRGKNGKTWEQIEGELLSASEINVTIKVNKGGTTVEIPIYCSVPENISFRHVISQRKIQLAMSGDMSAIKDLQDRDIGKAKERITLTTNDEQASPLTSEQKILLAKAAKLNLVNRLDRPSEAAEKAEQKEKADQCSQTSPS